MKKEISTWIFLALLTFSLSFTLKAQQTEQKFVQQTSYLLYLPDGYSNDTTQRWPLLLSLHGAGEVGTDIEKVKVHGPAKLIARGKKFPFIVVSPQSQQNGWKADQLHELLLEIKKKYRVDNERVYVTGLSMGGFGTWELALKYYSEFAAIVPICGGGDASEIWKLRHMPVWCFHGAKDPIVSLSFSQRMMKELEKDNFSSKFTVYPEAYHDCWTETYSNDSLYSWLLAQKRFRNKRVETDKNILSKYVGKYYNPKIDTVSVDLKNNTLMISLKKDSKLNPMPPLEIIPSADDLFFLNEYAPDDIRFVKNKDGIVTGFIFYSREKMEFNKVSSVNKRKTLK
jgi:predicted esterase